mmetsp:Transcript_57908/g.169286  ORF Transcript_57908/g.169286 Transcript_57908/m.169286 type:complete len:272 (-) Transcript_57908:663-1478(-)
MRIAVADTIMKPVSMKMRIELRPVLATNQPTMVFPQRDPKNVAAESTTVGSNGMALAIKKLIVALLLTMVIITVTVAVVTAGSKPALNSIGFKTMPPPMPTIELKVPTAKHTPGLTSAWRTHNPVASKKQKAMPLMNQYSHEHILTPINDGEPFPPLNTRPRIRMLQTTNKLNQAPASGAFPLPQYQRCQHVNSVAEGTVSAEDDPEDAFAPDTSASSAGSSPASRVETVRCAAAWSPPAPTVEFRRRRGPSEAVSAWQMCSGSWKAEKAE